jgi:hypothetical protein
MVSIKKFFFEVTVLELFFMIPCCRLHQGLKMLEFPESNIVIR